MVCFTWDCTEEQEVCSQVLQPSWSIHLHTFYPQEPPFLVAATCIPYYLNEAFLSPSMTWQLSFLGMPYSPGQEQHVKRGLALCARAPAICNC